MRGAIRRSRADGRDASGGSNTSCSAGPATDQRRWFTDATAKTKAKKKKKEKKQRYAMPVHAFRQPDQPALMSRILLADDSPHAQRMGERILREEGFEVVSLTDGDTALLRLADVDPD